MGAVTWAYEMGLDLYVDILENMDPRVDSFFLMGSPSYPLILVGLYLFLVFAVAYYNWMKEMENNLTLCSYITKYNLIVLLLNLVVGFNLSNLIRKAEYAYSCQRVRFKSGDIYEDSLPDWLWYFLIIKIIEMLDTFWIVLKGKRENLTPLHVYHHATIVLLAWIGVRFTPGGMTAFFAKYNSMTQVFLSSYFFLANSVGLDFKYKNILPVAELVQVIALSYVIGNGLLNQCGYPNWLLTILSLYMFSYVSLFISLYLNRGNKASSK